MILLCYKGGAELWQRLVGLQSLKLPLRKRCSYFQTADPTATLKVEVICTQICSPGAQHRAKHQDWLHTLLSPVQNNSAEPLIQKAELDFPGGTVDKNTLANAGNKGSIPGLERFYML